MATLGYALLVEPQNIELERLDIRLPSAAGRLPEEGLRILHLSDSHFSGREWREQGKIERVKQLVRDVECDLLIHTGDLVHYDSGLPECRGAARRAANTAAGGICGVWQP